MEESPFNGPAITTRCSNCGCFVVQIGIGDLPSLQSGLRSIQLRLNCRRTSSEEACQSLDLSVERQLGHVR
jgi:hypothetical protein